MALLADVLFGLVGMDESLVSHQQVTSGESFCADVANEWLLLCVSSDMALQMFLAQLSQ